MLRQPAARSSSSIVDVVVAVLEEDDGDDLDIANDAAGVATAVPFAAVVLDYVLVVVVAVLFFHQRCTIRSGGLLFKFVCLLCLRQCFAFVCNVDINIYFKE